MRIGPILSPMSKMQEAPWRPARERGGSLAFAAALLAAWPTSGRAQGAPADAPTRLAPVVVTATRTAEPPFDLPA